MISQSNFSTNVKARSVLPIAVGPAIKIMGLLKISCSIELVTPMAFYIAPFGEKIFSNKMPQRRLVKELRTKILWCVELFIARIIW
jgi:hypothetical protein